MRALTIFTRYGSSKYAASFAELLDSYRQRLGGLATTLLIVDNALPSPGRVVGPHDGDKGLVIAGDNSVSEFSAWDVGLKFARERDIEFDVLHIVTETFNSLYTGYLKAIDRAALLAIQPRPVCLGNIDYYNDEIEVLGHKSQCWIRTAYFFLSRSLVDRIGSFVSVREATGLFSSDPLRPFAIGAPISSRYQSYILDWLGGEDLGQGQRWHSRLDREQRLEEFKRKALAILNEHMLSVRIRELGGSLVDAIWLQGQLKSCVPAERIDWHTSWKRQLSERPFDQHALA